MRVLEDPPVLRARKVVASNKDLALQNRAFYIIWIKELEAFTTDSIDEVKGSHEELREDHDALKGDLKVLEDKVMNAIQVMQTQVNKLGADLERVMRATSREASPPSVGTMAMAPRTDLPKPREFDGKRDAKELEDFIWRMERYFEGANIVDEAQKVRTSTLYLTDTAALWWRRKHAEIESGTSRIDTWEDLKKELKAKFYPTNVVYEARKKLRELKHKGNIKEYVKEFTTLVLQIPNLTEEDELFYFVDGLQAWAKQEVQRRGANTLDEAITCVESLSEFQRSMSEAPQTSRGPKVYSGKGGGVKEYPKRPAPRREFTPRPATSQTRPGDKKKATPTQRACFICKGPHFMRDCPKLGTLAAIAEDKGHDTQVEQHEEQCGSLQLINSLKAKVVPQANKSKGLMYVEAKINNKPTLALVDSGATNNFITEDEARRLGLKVVQGGGVMKAVNSPTTPLAGIVQGANIQLGTWSGKVNFSVARMDDFKLVLGLDFMRKVNAIPMPSFDTMCILERGASCMVPTIAKETGHLSAMQVEKGLKKGEATYLACLRMDDTEEGGPSQNKEDIPPIIQNVLEEYKHVMPPD